MSTQPSYYDATAQDILVAACIDPTCTQPATITTIETTGNLGVASAVAIIGGKPVIAYTDSTRRSIKVASCSTPNCTGTITIKEVDKATVMAGAINPDLSMIVVGGNPFLAYQNPNSSEGLRVLACMDPACAAAVSPTNLLASGEINKTSVTLIGANPVIAFGLDSSPSSLNLAACNNPTCTSAVLTTLTGGIVDSGTNPSLTNVNNQPAISYYDSKNNQLRFYFGGDEGYGLTTTPTPSATVTPTLTFTPSATPYPTPAQVGTLISNTSGTADNFGYAVAVSGDTIVVGAPNHDYSGMTDAGAAYVYHWNGTIWAQQAELLPSDPATDDLFGSALGIFGDTVIVGAYGNDDAGTASGAAYIFTRSGTVWTQQQKLTAPDAAADDSFAHAVAISVDSVIIGADGNDQGAFNAGAAYIFTRNGSVWSMQQKLVAGDPLAGSQFGYAVDLYADTAVVGAPLPVTAVGAAYVFVRNDGVWAQQQKLTPAYNFTRPGDHFGNAVAVYNDAIAVGAPYTEYLLPSVGDDGSIQVYYRQDATWVYQAEYANIIPSAIPSTEPQLGGYAVDVYRESFVAGVPFKRPFASLQTGFAYVIAKGAYLRSDPLLVSTPPSVGNGDRFGWAISRDGSVVVVGAPYNDYASIVDPGAAFIYKVVAPPWEPTASVTPSLTPSNTPPSPTSQANAMPAQNFFTTHNPILTWNRVAGAVGYRIEIDDMLDFKTLVDSGETDANTLYYPTNYLNNRTYFWRVCAKINATTCGAWSAVQSFMISAA